jgi:cellulose synthase/poly-beta-1,6-N-acetylglucosamine synthase-like glycosyltransferase
MIVLDLLLTAAAALAAIPAALFLAEVVAAAAGERRIMGAQSGLTANAARPSACVLVPAHDEAAGIAETVRAVRRQLEPGDRLLVVADNCTDDTGRIAAEAGAGVAVRNDPARRGKGYALAFGIDQLRSDPPGCVIILDADCTPGERLVDTLARRCAETGRPVQARYDMVIRDDSSPEQTVAAFSWLVRNYVRPLGLSVLGLPCQLMGSGMAFPWIALARAELATGHIVEDLKMGLDLAASGSAPVFEPRAHVTSSFARTEGAMVTQRRRWETGALAVMTQTAPRLAWQALKTGDVKLLALAVDAMIPPLVLFIFTLTSVVALAAVMTLAAPTMSLPVVALGWGMMMAGLVLAWLRFGRQTLTLPGPGILAGFVMRKLAIYKRAGGWVRTGRD